MQDVIGNEDYLKTNIISLTYTLLLPYMFKHQDVCVQVAQVPRCVSR